MALGSCKECGQQVSSGAKTCPHCGVKKPYKKIPRKATLYDFTILMVVLVAMLIMVYRSDNNEGSSENVTQSRGASIGSKYESRWHTDVHLEISQALVKSEIRNCGEYKYKQSRTHQGEYVVYCTRDGTNWVSYLVWTGTKKVMGPYKTDPSLGT